MVIIMKTKQSTELYGIIGLGRFGFALAKTLSDSGKEILVVDSSESKIKEATAFTDNAFVVDNLNKENLQFIGIQNCDTVVVCIGEKIDTSILTTLIVLQLGVKRVLAKAISTEQGCILETLGAEVVYPERDMAVRVANKLVAPCVLEYISLSDDIDITEIKLTSKIDNMTVEMLDLRRNYGLNIIAIKQHDTLTIDILPSMTLNKDNTITVVGKRSNIQKFEKYLT